MVLVNYADRKVNCKIVYYGAEESGKTSNLIYIFNQLDETTRSNLITLESSAERTLFFDFMSLNLGEVKGFSTTFSLYTVPGQIEYNDARKLILNGVDGLVFVADSDPNKRDSNIESYKNMLQNKRETYHVGRPCPMGRTYGCLFLFHLLPHLQDNHDQ